jgi:hypothetical protein
MPLFRFQNTFVPKRLPSVIRGRVRAQEVFPNEKYHEVTHRLIVRSGDFLAGRRAFQQFCPHYAANSRWPRSDSALAPVLNQR